LYFFTLIRDGIDTGLVSALRNKISRIVVAAEEVVQMRKDFLLDSCKICVGKLLAEFLHLWTGVGSNPELRGSADSLLQVALNLRTAVRIQAAECFLHLWQQIRVEESGDLVPLSRHDPVNAKIELRLVKHKQFCQQVPEFLIGSCAGRKHLS